MHATRDMMDDWTLRAYVHGRDRFERTLDRLAAAEGGQTTAEYVAVIVLIAGLIGLIAGNTAIGNAIRDAIVAAFNKVKTTVSGGG